MREKLKILALSGSPRRQSFNRLILQTAMLGAEKAGAEVTLVDLRALPIADLQPGRRRAQRIRRKRFGAAKTFERTRRLFDCFARIQRLDYGNIEKCD